MRRKESDNKKKYYDKMKAMEEHYERVIQKLVEDLEGRRSGKGSEKCEGIKTSHNIKGYDNSRLSSASNRIAGRKFEGDNSYHDEIEWETDLTPAEELSVTDRKRMNENTDIINNDSLLTSFYK